MRNTMAVMATTATASENDVKKMGIDLAWNGLRVQTAGENG